MDCFGADFTHVLPIVTEQLQLVAMLLARVVN